MAFILHIIFAVTILSILLGVQSDPYVPIILGPCDDESACTFNDMNILTENGTVCIGETPSVTLNKNVSLINVGLPEGVWCAAALSNDALGPAHDDCVTFFCDNDSPPGSWHWVADKNGTECGGAGVGYCDVCGRCVIYYIAQGTSRSPHTMTWWIIVSSVAMFALFLTFVVVIVTCIDTHRGIDEKRWVFHNYGRIGY